MITEINKLKLYNPHGGQLSGHESQKRFNIHCWGRQSGKTTFGLEHTKKKSWTGPRDGNYWYVLQTYAAARVAFQRVYRTYQVNPMAFASKPNKTTLSFQFFHGPRVAFKSGKNYQDLRIETLDGVVIDEYRQQHPDLWPMIIRPMLAARNGWAQILSTANGFDDFFDLFEAAKFDPEWAWSHNPSTIAPWWTEKEINSCRRTMSEALYEQEILALFRDLASGKAYLNYGPWNLLTSNPFASPGRTLSQYLPIVVACDFNISPMSWTLGQHKFESIHWFDEIVLNNSNTQEASKELVERVKDHKPGVIIIGDATSKARQRAAAGKSDYDIIFATLKDAGIKYENKVPDSNPGVKDRVNTLNCNLKSAGGVVTLTLDPIKCKVLKKDFERVLWKQGAEATLDEGSKKDLGHSSAGVGYAHCVLTPIPEINVVGTSRLIRRS
jgi:hypothetical protein